jgi:rhodanese-related sulfurtransferase
MLEFSIETHPDFQDKTRPIVVYCKSGGRSALATATLQQLGFTNVYSMIGGYDAWSAASNDAD